MKKEEKDIEELAPGKVVFLLSRNQDDPNLFHGGSEVINAVSMMYLLNLEPKDIQVIFLESIEIPYYESYTFTVVEGDGTDCFNFSSFYNCKFCFFIYLLFWIFGVLV